MQLVPAYSWLCFGCRCIILMRFFFVFYRDNQDQYNSDILQQFNDLPFYLLNVSAPFNPTSSFYHVDLSLKKFTAKKSKYYVRFDTLFNFKSSLLSEPSKRPHGLVKSIKKLIQRLKESRQYLWSSDFLREDAVILELCKTILVPLFDDVALEPRYKSKCKQTGAKAQDIGLGSVDTWHGMPDVRIGCCCMVSTKEPLHADEEDNDSIDELLVPIDQDSSTVEQEPIVLQTRSPSSAASIEEKLTMKTCHTSQLVALSVMSSFTQHNLEPEENSLVPTIMISSSGFKVCLYDCVHDILLISDVKNISHNGHLSPSGILMLWIVVNHRLFLRPLTSDHLKHLLDYKSTIIEKLKTFSVYDDYCKLQDLNVNWGGICKDPDSPTFPRTELLPPSSKRMKHTDSD